MDAAPETDRIQKADTDGIDRLVVGAAILRKGKVLLLRRRADDFMPGIYELPSGVVEAGETLQQALAREVAEETGLEMVEIEDYIGCFDYSSASGRVTRQFNFLARVDGLTPLALREHDHYVWVGPEDLTKLPVTPETGQVVQAALGRETKSKVESNTRT